MVPRMLSRYQKETKLTLAGDRFTIADQDVIFFKNIITGDGTFFFFFHDPQTKRQSSEWKSATTPCTPTFRLGKSKGIVLVEVVFDSSGGPTVIRDTCIEIV